MQKLNYIIIILSMLSILLNASSDPLLAQTNSAGSVNALLQGYNVSNSMINSLKLTPINFSGNTYLLAYSSGNPSFLINTTGGTYSIVLNSSQITSIISTTIIQSSISKINSTYLQEQMQDYNESSAGSLASCVTEVGFDRGTCTQANFCASCATVPVCRKVIAATGGIYGGFAQGIIQFENEYNDLNSNFSLYFSSTKSINSKNVQSSLKNITGAFNNISSITNFLYQNPVFPPPPTADYSQCTGYGSSTSNVVSNGGPWYCSSLGFCQFLTYNYTLLGNIQSYINHINTLPISTSQISQISLSISTNENIYVVPILSEKKLNQVNHIINTTLMGYNSTVAGVSSLLSHISNKTLQNDLAKVKANYSSLTTNYVQSNLTKLNKTLSTQYSTLKTVYSQLNSSYTSIVTLAANNTVLLVELQSGNKNPSVQLTSLSFQEAGFNSQLGGSIKNVSSLNAQLQALSQQAKSLTNNPSFSQSTERVLGAPAAKLILGIMGTPYSNALQLVPLLSVIPSIIIGILFLIALFWFHKTLIKNHRIAFNVKTKKNWTLVFGAAGGVVLLFLASSYVIASAANQNAPISAFVGAVHGSKTVIIALNGTNTTAMINCVSKIKSSLKAINKNTQTITMSGIACNNGMPLETTDKCLSYYAQNNEPVIIFTNSSTDSITAYSYYGSILNINGDSDFMNMCIASTMIR